MDKRQFPHLPSGNKDHKVQDSGSRAPVKTVGVIGLHFLNGIPHIIDWRDPGTPRFDHLFVKLLRFRYLCRHLPSDFTLNWQLTTKNWNGNWDFWQGWVAKAQNKVSWSLCKIFRLLNKNKDKISIYFQRKKYKLWLRVFIFERRSKQWLFNSTPMYWRKYFNTWTFVHSVLLKWHVDIGKMW